MSLDSLPTELFRHILESVLLDPDNGLYNALHCRLISSNVPQCESHLPNLDRFLIDECRNF